MRRETTLPGILESLLIESQKLYDQNSTTISKEVLNTFGCSLSAGNPSAHRSICTIFNSKMSDFLPIFQAKDTCLVCAIFVMNVLLVTSKHLSLAHYISENYCRVRHGMGKVLKTLQNILTGCVQHRCQPGEKALTNLSTASNFQQPSSRT